MNRATGITAAILTASLLLSGCGNQIPDMTEEEQAMIVSYAAEVVERHDSNHPSRLESEEVVELKKEEEAQKEAKKEQLKQEEAAKAEETKNNEASSSEAAKQKVELTLDDVVGADGFSFSYEGYELDDSYPDTGEETYFAMDATEGQKLLVLKFLAHNVSGEDRELSMVSSGVRFKITAGGKTQNALTTMLLNDFSNFSETIPGNGTQELVLICEVPADGSVTEGGSDSIAVIVRNGDKNATISLQ